jgi:hypothetical protein
LSTSARQPQTVKTLSSFVINHFCEWCLQCCWYNWILEKIVKYYNFCRLWEWGKKQGRRQYDLAVQLNVVLTLSSTKMSFRTQSPSPFSQLGILFGICWSHFVIVRFERGPQNQMERVLFGCKNCTTPFFSVRWSVYLTMACCTRKGLRRAKLVQRFSVLMFLILLEILNFANDLLL